MTIVSARSTHQPDTAAEICVLEQASANSRRWGARWLRPLVVERLMLVADAALIFASGIGCAITYHLYAHSILGKADVYAAASLLVAINFTLLTIVQHGYRLENLTNLPRAVRMTLMTWTGLFGALLAIAFTMKVSEEFSRGTTISFSASGIRSADDMQNLQGAQLDGLRSRPLFTHYFGPHE